MIRAAGMWQGCPRTGVIQRKRRGRSTVPSRGRSYVPEDDPKDARAARAWNEVNIVIDTRDEEKG